MAKRIREEKTEKGIKTYRVIFNDNSSAKYSEARYGNKAKSLAEIAFQDEIKYGNYFEFEDEYVKLYLWYKPDKTFKIAYLDKDDFERDEIRLNYWQAKRDKQNFYVYREEGNSRLKNKIYYKLHNVVYIKNDDTNIVDHINSNGLDNRKSNLRELTSALNSRNVNRPRGSVPIIGVQYSEKYNGFEATWYTGDGKPRSKRFLLEKYENPEQALYDACEYRNKMIDKYNYPCDKIKLDSIPFSEIIFNLNLD